MTSVKDFFVDEEPTDNTFGRGGFVFSDRYSVFDWGEMPDHIPGKGASLCVMGAYNFELLEDRGIPTHYRGVQANDRVHKISDVTDPVTRMAIDLTQVPELPYGGGTYDYDRYFAEAGENYLIPLEVVFRNRIPEGSSLRRRRSPGDVGLSGETWPDEVVELDQPIVEFSTKYEEKDRYLEREEAARIAGKADLDRLEDVARAVNECLCDRAAASGMTHDDGKIECLYHNGDIRVADVVGTFDENRFTFRDHQLSKEVIRQFYRKNHPDWLEAIDRAKKRSEEEGHGDWRELTELDPEPLPRPVLNGVSNMYKAGANTYTGSRWFDVPPLGDVMDMLSKTI